MNKTIVLDKHEMVVDKDMYERLLSDSAKLNSFITFVKWCKGENFDYDDMRTYIDELLGMVK